MPRPEREIDGVRASHQRLHRTLDELEPGNLTAVTLLPGWTVAHVLTHLARNADSVVRRLEAVRRGEIVEQYAGGQATRTAQIEDGASRLPETVVDDLRASDDHCDAALDAFELWDEPFAPDRQRTCAHLALARWREVEIHHTDLSLGYGFQDWPALLVATELPKLLFGLQDRTDERHLMAWALGRARPPQLDPWS